MADYQTVIKSNSIYSYKAFLSKWKRSSYNSDIENRLTNKIWADAKNTNTIDGYNRYVEKYPNTQYVSEAEEIIVYNKAKK